MNDVLRDVRALCTVAIPLNQPVVHCEYEYDHVVKSTPLREDICTAWDKVSCQIRQGPSGPAFRTRAGGALGTTGHNRSQYHNQVHQEGQKNENQV